MPPQFNGTYTGPLSIIVTKCTVFVIIACLVVVCNSMSLTVLCSRRNQTGFDVVSLLYYKILAVADIAGGILSAVLNVALSLSDGVPTARPVCEWIPLVYFTIVLQSLILLSYIGINKYIMVVKPLRYPTLVTPYRAKIALGFSLCLSFVTIPLLPVSSFPFTEVFRQVCLAELVIFSEHIQNLFLAITLTPVALATLIITLTNSHLLFIAWRHHQRQLRPTTEGRRDSVGNMKGVKTFVIVTGAFYLAWMPWSVSIILHLFHDFEASGWIHFATALLNLNKYWWNPFICIFTNRTFRKSAMIVFCRKHRNSKIVTDLAHQCSTANQLKDTSAV